MITKLEMMELASVAKGLLEAGSVSEAIEHLDVIIAGKVA